MGFVWGLLRSLNFRSNELMDDLSSFVSSLAGVEDVFFFTSLDMVWDWRLESFVRLFVCLRWVGERVSGVECFGLHD